MAIARLRCQEASADVLVEGGELLWECFAGLPTGWSWGLYFRHEALSECCRRAMRAVQVKPHLLADRAPPAARPWCRPLAIHHGEARAALLELRREAGQAGSHGGLLLSLGDNMAEILDIETGRAKERGLLAQAGEAAALQTASGRGLRRRCVETGPNPSGEVTCKLLGA